MAKKSMYLVKSTPNGYQVIKCSESFDYEGYYAVNKIRKFGLECNCPASSSNCRHIQMVKLFKRKKAVDSGKFYCFDTEEWFEPRAME